MRQVLSTIGVALLFIGVLSDVPYRNGFGTTVFIAAAPPPAQSRSLTPRQKKLFPPQDLGLLSAPDRAADHLNVLASLSMLLHSENVRTKLRQAADSAAALQVLCTQRSAFA